MILSLPIFAISSAFAFFILTSIRPRVGVALLVATLPLYVLRFSIYGIPTTLFEFLLIGTTVGWFTHMVYMFGWRVLWPSSRAAIDPANPFAPYLTPILLWLLAGTIAMIVSPDLERALGLWRAYFIQPLLVFGMVVLSFRHRDEKAWLLWSLGASVIVVGVVAALQALGIRPLPDPYATAETFRATSLYPYPNAVGLFVAPITALFVAWWLQRIDRESVTSLILKSLVVAFGVLGIVLSLTKGAMFGLVAAVLIIAVTLRGLARRLLLGGVAMVMIALLVLPMTREVIFEQATLSAPSGLMRRAVWSETIALLRDTPIRGAGLAGYQTAVEPYHVDWRPEITPYKIEIFLYPHNVFLNAWVETGLLGLISFVWLLAVFYRLAWKQRSMPLSAMALAGMTALLVHGLVDVPYFKNDLAVLFWLIMALPLLERRRVHHMHLHPDPYRMIATGQKTVEVRVADPKRRRVAEGDVIMFYPERGTYESVHVVVEKVITRETFVDIFEHVEPSEVGYSELQDALRVLSEIYSESEEMRHGAIAYRLKRIG